MHLGCSERDTYMAGHSSLSAVRLASGKSCTSSTHQHLDSARPELPVHGEAILAIATPSNMARSNTATTRRGGKGHQLESQQSEQKKRPENDTGYGLNASSTGHKARVTRAALTESTGHNHTAIPTRPSMFGSTHVGPTKLRRVFRTRDALCSHGLLLQTPGRGVVMVDTFLVGKASTRIELVRIQVERRLFVRVSIALRE